MNILFCRPEITMVNTGKATEFLFACKEILDKYILNIKYISTSTVIKQIVSENVSKDDIFVFFTSETGKYDDLMIRLLKKINDQKSRIWAVAMEATPECRKPPDPVSNKQSFDVVSRIENRSPLMNNLKAVAQVFARKIISQALSPLYQDEVLYFISHRRSDGEKVAGKLAQKLTTLTRETNVYRDVICVQVGDDAQKDIDEHLAVSDVLIFLQTEETSKSKYIIKELNYALIYNIPILWIQMDGADYQKLELRPSDAPTLKYRSEEFFEEDRLTEIVSEIEDMCFQLIMNCSNHVYSHIEYLDDMKAANKIILNSDINRLLAYDVEYKEQTRDIYDDGIRRHYIQCFGRNPKEKDIAAFVKRMEFEKEIYQKHDKLFLLSGHGKRDKQTGNRKICEENFEDYIVNLENVSGVQIPQLNKRIIISGAFPDYDEIYKNSLSEAIVIYARQIIRRGYTLVFGAHPTFQKAIFDIGALYSSDVKYSIEMHMDEAYLGYYDVEELQEKCNLILSHGLQEMREKMILKNKAEMMICLGGKIKKDKKEQGVDIEIEIAKNAGIPIALVGTVGGRSSEYAYELLQKSDWTTLNLWGNEINEGLFYNLNHRVMINRLLNKIV